MGNGQEGAGGLRQKRGFIKEREEGEMAGAKLTSVSPRQKKIWEGDTPLVELKNSKKKSAITGERSSSKEV